MKTYCFKLYNSKRNKKLKIQINAAGLIYNRCIALHKRYYRLYGKRLKKYKLEKHLTKLRHLKKFSYFREIDSQAIQNIADRIERAYSQFYSKRKNKLKASPPNFKKVRKYKSFTLKQAGWKLNEESGIIEIGKQNYIYLEGMKKLYGRKVSDLVFYSFVQKLKYEASRFGTHIIFI